MNTASGPVEEQIFDIRQRRWPICYMLEDANSDGIRRAKEYLSGQLYDAILMVMNSEHEAVDEAISRLTPEAVRLIEHNRVYDYFWIANDDVGKLGAFWMGDAIDCLLGLKLIRTYFEARHDANRYVNTWTYLGKLVIKRMEPNFPPVPPRTSLINT
jgi:hypothetical protein